MKKFTKGALIAALVFVILGFTLCAVGAGIGFHYSSIPQMIRDGAFTFNGSWEVWNDWSEAKTEKFDFSADEIQNLNIDMDCGDVEIERATDSQKIEVEVKYQRTNTKRTVQVEHDADTLDIVESKNIKFISNDNVRITVRIPEGKEFHEVDLQNDVGSISVNYVMNVKTCNIMIDTGECDINSKLNVTDKLYAEVDAGKIDIDAVKAEEMELDADVGSISVERAVADKTTLNCDIGEIDVTMEGRESDFNYYIKCDIGEISLGEDDYSGLDREKEVQNGADKSMDISCDIGSVEVEFTK